MAKIKTIYACQQCGSQSPKWLGRCPDCGAWNSLVEEQAPTSGPTSAALRTSTNAPVPLNEISPNEAGERIVTGISELDRVLGSGIFRGSAILLAGEPGIGKSTLSLQMAIALQESDQKVLYVSGEESLTQIRNRAQRLAPEGSELLVLSETNLENIAYRISTESPAVVIIDSIQAIYNPALSGAPGNVAQVRECATRLFQLTKENQISLLLIGHVTKEGSVAGPKILEHLVDVVVNFEGNIEQHRILRTVKNRFGAANELGIFEMFSDGLREVKDPSGVFIDRERRPAVGSAVVCSYEGTRPLLIEVQALVGRSNYGTPQRIVSGFNQRRLSLILAIMEKYCRLSFGVHDVFVKVAGGLHLDDPGIDMGVAAALYSSFLEKPMLPDAVYLGELGLGGEVRAISFSEKRLMESQRLGFKRVFLPEGNAPEAETAARLTIGLTQIGKIDELLYPPSE